MNINTLPMEWMGDFVISDEEIAMMKSAKFLIPNLAISSQITILAAKPGCGKTTVLMHECGLPADNGYNVRYVNLDCGAGDIGHWKTLANKAGFDLVTPHFSGPQAVNDWINGLRRIADSDYDLAQEVIVIDTFKKIADLMSKREVKAVMNTLRALTAKGCTVICAAHCNKHSDKNGQLVFEGVGDVESDCDNLVYMVHADERNGERIVTTAPSDKVRGAYTPRSWSINRDRSVVALDEHVEVNRSIELAKRAARDQEGIEIIRQGILSGSHTREALCSYAETDGVTARKFNYLIKTYCAGKSPQGVTPIWENVTPAGKGHAEYRLIGRKGA